MSAPRIRTSGPKLGPVQLSSFSLPKHSAERNHQPTSSPTTKRKPAAEDGRLQSAGATAGAWPSKYLLIAMLGVLMAALLACGGSTEPGGGQSSSSVASASTAVPTDEPTAAQAAAVATPTDTPVPAVVSEPPRTLTTTDASPQAMPTDTPAPTHTATLALEPTSVPKRGGILTLTVAGRPENWDTEAGKEVFLGESGAWQVIHEELDRNWSIMVVPSPGYESDRGGPYLEGIEILVPSFHLGVSSYPDGILWGIQSGNIQGSFGPMKEEVAAHIIEQAVWTPHIRVHTWGDRVSDKELVLAAATGNWFPPSEVPTTLIDCRVRGYQSTDLPQSLDDWVHVWWDEESSCVSDEEAGMLYTPSGKATRKPQVVSDQPVAVLTPGIALGEEVWWWRPQHDDYTPPAVLENHPHRLQLTRLHNADIWTLMLDQVVAVLRESNPIPADQEAEAIARMTKSGFVNGWGWEIADANEPLVMYWSTVRWGDKEHRVGALVRYGSSGEPEGFVQASPKPEFAPEPDLDGVWYAKKQTGETSSAGTYENHPYGAQLDLLDGVFDHHPHLTMPHAGFMHARGYYQLAIQVTLENTFIPKIAEAEGSFIGVASREAESIFREFYEKSGWEVTSMEQAEVRYWATIGDPHNPYSPTHIKKRMYRIGFTIRFEADQPLPYRMRMGVEYPIEKFLDHPTLVSDIIVEPVE